MGRRWKSLQPCDSGQLEPTIRASQPLIEIDDPPDRADSPDLIKKFKIMSSLEPKSYDEPIDGTSAIAKKHTKENTCYRPSV